MSKELDEQVAIEVMGWKKSESGIAWITLNERFGIPWTHEAEDMLIPWSPSTDIKDAWEVVEKIKENNWITIDWLEHEPEWTITLGKLTKQFRNISLPTAVCEAALAFVRSGK